MLGTIFITVTLHKTKFYEFSTYCIMWVLQKFPILEYFEFQIFALRTPSLYCLGIHSVLMQNLHLALLRVLLSLIKEGIINPLFIFLS